MSAESTNALIQTLDDDTTEYMEWTPIGYSTTYCFQGEFDGNGNTIKYNLTTSNTYQGLFAYFAGTMHDLTVEGSITETGSTYTAGVVANNYGGTIYDVTNKVNITASATIGGLGGVVGYSNGGTLTNVTNEGNITYKITETSASVRYIGGVVGNNSSTVKGATNNGTVTVNMEKSGTSACMAYVGGVIGYAGNTLSDVTNTGAVDVSMNAGGIIYAYVGGIVGNAAGSITGAVNSADVTVASDCTGTTTSIYPIQYVGGIAGTTTKGLTNCENNGNITGNVTAAGGSSSNIPRDNVGGIVGYMAGAVSLTHLQNTGEVYGEAAYTTYGRTCAGGIIGYSYTANTIITEAYNEAPVSADTTGGTNRYAFAGGIAGYVYAATTFRYTGNTGDVTISGSSTAAYNGSGGILGFKYSSVVVTMESAYNTGEIIDNGGGNYAGGLAGYLGGTGTTFTNIYNADAATGGKLYAYPTATKYTVYNGYYNAGDGMTGPTDAQPYNEADMKTAAFADEVGYAFAAQTSEFPALHCFADPEENTVTLDYQESTFKTLEHQTYAEADSLVRVALTGGKIAEPDVYERTGLTFDGWYHSTSTTDVDRVDFAEETFSPGDTLYARWSITKITVTLDYGYNDGNSAPVIAYTTAEYNRTMEKPIPTRDGYDFVGWYLVDDEGVLATTNFDFSTLITGPITLMAKWQTGLTTTNYDWYFDDESADSFHITNEQEFFAFAKVVNGTAKEGTEAVDFTDKTVYLDVDIDLPAEGIIWTAPIGSSLDNMFNGTFVGYNGSKTIIVDINMDMECGVQALFGYTGADATIEDLTVDGSVTVVGGTAADARAYIAADARAYIAAVVAYNQGTLTNVVNESDITLGEVPNVSYVYIGGVVAYNNKGALAAVSNAGDIVTTMNETYTSSQYRYVGGTVGYNYTGVVEDIQNSGAVTLTADGGATSFLNRYTGGVFGYNTGTIAGAKNTGPVQVDITKSATSSYYYVYTGGITGYTSATVSDAVNAGTVDVTALTPSITGYTGGIAGNATSAAVMTSVSNTADVRFTETALPGSASTVYTGGLVGSMANSATDSTNTGNVVSDISSLGVVTGNLANYVGGIGGYISSALTLTNCGNEGDITGTADSSGTSTYSSNSYVGGIVGNASGAITATQLWNTGDITAEAARDDATTANAAAGGIVGYGAGAVSVSEGYNEGEISANVTGANSYAGGFIGYAGGASTLRFVYNDAAVTAAGGTTYAGGLIGSRAVGASFIENAYNLGTVTGDNTYVGGLVGYVAVLTTFTNVYNAGVSTGGDLYGDAVASTVTMNNGYYLAASDNVAGDGSLNRSDAAMKADAFAVELGQAFLAVSGDYPVLHCFADPTGEVVTFNFQQSQLYILGGSYSLRSYAEVDSTTRVAVNAFAVPTVYPVEGFVFKGWCDDAAGTNLIDMDTYTPTAGDMLYAKWERYGVAVTLSYGNGDPDGTISVEYDSPIGALENPAWAGHEFIGWYLLTDASTGATEDTLFALLTTKVTTQITLVAKWQELPSEEDYAWYIDTVDDEPDSFVITNRSELIAFRELVNGTAEYYDGGPVDFAGETVELANNIVLDGIWTASIGAKEETPFAGTFDGKDCTISGLLTSSEDDMQGFFGYVEGATIQHVTVGGTIAKINTGSYFGGVVVKVLESTEPTTLSHVTSNVTISGDSYMGGLVAYNAGALLMDNCVNGGTVTGTDSYVAGLVGCSEGTIKLDSCSNRNDVNGTGSTGLYVSGIVGRSAGVIELLNCANNNAVKGAGTYVSGLVGYSEGALLLDHCTNSGAVTGSKTYVGGQLGYGADAVELSECINESAVQASGNYAGGLIGGLSTPPADESGVHVKRVLSAVTNNGNVTANSYLGGLVGIASDGLEIDTSTNTASVTGPNAFGSAGTDAGGLVGTAGDDLKISNSINQGSVTVSQYAGGLVGYAGSDFVIAASANEAPNDEEVSGIGSYHGGILARGGDKGLLVDCENYQALAVADSSSYSGGLIGYSGEALTIQGGRNEGAITGSYDCGGIVGHTTDDLTIEKSENGAAEDGYYVVNTGALITADTSTRNLGGMVGYVEDNANISYALNKGEIKRSSTRYTSKIEDCVGGIIGMAGDGLTVTDSKNAGNVTNLGQGYYIYGGTNTNAAVRTGGIVAHAGEFSRFVRCINDAEITAYAVAGGIAGRLEAGCFGLEDCHNNGVVTTDGFSNYDDIVSTSYPTFTGGLVAILVEADADSMALNHCSNTGAVQFIGTGANGGRYTGGLVGMIGESTYVAEAAGAGIVDCWNAGTVSSTRDTHIGGLVGHLALGDGVLEDCYSTEHASVIAGTSGYYTGGLVGYLSAASGSSITDCCNNGSVTGNRVGGIAGVASASGANISGCWNTGEIAGVSTTSTSYDSGGLFGSLSLDAGSISNCWNEGTKNITGPIAGGLIGTFTSTDGTITNCRNISTGKVTGSMSSGGIAGTVGAGSGAIENCWNEGAVESTATASAVGGLFGSLGTNSVGLKDCYNTGTVTAEALTSSAVGGLVGTVAAGEAGAPVEMTNCYNISTGEMAGSGTVTGPTVIGDSVTGGLFGSVADYVEITKSYNTGAVTSGSPMIGGLVGSLSEHATISDCYNLGTISEDALSGTTTIMAGIAYLTGAGTIENCYSTVEIVEANAGAYTYGGIAAAASETDLENVYNSYYLAADTTAAGAIAAFGAEDAAKPASAFASGEVAYLLDGGDNAHRDVWTLGTSDGVTMPVIGEPSYYKVAVGDAANATIQVALLDTWASEAYAAKGMTVNVSVAVDEYQNAEDAEEQYTYVVENVFAKQGGTTYPATESGGVYTFTLGADENATVYAMIAKQSLTDPDDEEIVETPVPAASKSFGGSGGGLGTGDEDSSNGDQGNGDVDNPGGGTGDQGDGEDGGTTPGGQDEETTTTTPGDPDEQTTTTTDTSTNTTSDTPSISVSRQAVLPSDVTLAAQEQREDDGSTEETLQGGGGSEAEAEVPEVPVEEEDQPISQVVTPQNERAPQSILLIVLIIIVIAAILVISGIYNYRRKRR
ncbi:MAG: InlB B-repeat-containing protein [Oscillospiraceae bacterium]|nr:InlB B-repeat-containing protein [Oscillospiraceae bacterium]